MYTALGADVRYSGTVLGSSVGNMNAVGDWVGSSLGANDGNAIGSSISVFMFGPPWLSVDAGFLCSTVGADVRYSGTVLGS